MSAICQRSPCTRLTNALGRWVRANREGWFQRIFEETVPGQGKVDWVQIPYCPFCGTHLSEVHERLVEHLPARPKLMLHETLSPDEPELRFAPGAQPEDPQGPPPPPSPGLKPDGSRRTWKKRRIVYG